MADFTGLWIPIEIINLNISWSEKAMLREIMILSEKEPCTASNDHLAKILNINKRQVIRLIQNLENKCLIKILYKSQQKREIISKITSDKMSPVTTCHSDNLSPKLVTNCHPTSDNLSPQVVTKCHPTSDKMVKTSDNLSPKNKENIYKNIDRDNKENIVENNILSSKPDRIAETTNQVIDYLNQIAGKSFRATTPKTKTLIKARMKEGFVLHDFQVVIDKKYRQWRNSEMEIYIRPETLFGTKFEGYLNETDVVPIRKRPGTETPSERAIRLGQGAVEILREMEANNE